jgi:tripartite-type tricarboxylate transporter receptor subunit TctC
MRDFVICHSRESGKTRPQAEVSRNGHPSPLKAKWIPAFAGMTRWVFQMYSLIRVSNFAWRALTNLIVIAFLALSWMAWADTYPSKTIKIIVPYSPGGGSDITARIIATKLSKKFGQTVVVENRAGAGGNIAHDLIAKAAPDGYSIMIAGMSLVTNAYLQEKLPYDPLADFAPITLAVRVPNVLAVNNDVPAKSLKELIALAKAKPGTLAYASAGNGTSLHLAAELLQSMAQIELIHIPYKGSGPAETDLISGQVQIILDPISSALPHIKAGNMRALAITTGKRSKLLPDVPTMAEAGLTGYDSAAWFGFFAPAKTPPAIVDKLNREIVGILKEKDVQEKLVGLGIEFIGTPVKELETLMRTDSVKWQKVFARSK